MNETKKPIDSPLRAIKQYCLDCSGDSVFERKECPSKDCPLYPFRLGKNTFRKKRILTEEQKQKNIARMEKVRNSR